jgi:hypothetical protein
MKTTSVIGIIAIISISIFLFWYYGGMNNNDVDNLKNELRSGNFKAYSSIADIPKETYTKPEFYTSYEMFKNRTDKNQFGTYGYGAYPGEVSYNVTGLKAGQYIDAYTFVHSSYDVGNYQGLRLSLKSPNDGLFNTSVEPSEILLEPLSLDAPETTPNWTYRIKMRISTKKDIPDGKYVFKLNVGSPSPEKEREYHNLTDKYIRAGMIQPGKFFDLVLYTYK